MTFSSLFLTGLIYGALVWCVLTSLVLIILLINEGRKGELW